MKKLPNKQLELPFPTYVQSLSQTANIAVARAERHARDGAAAPAKASTDNTPETWLALHEHLHDQKMQRRRSAVKGRSSLSDLGK